MQAMTRVCTAAALLPGDCCKHILQARTAAESASVTQLLPALPRLQCGCAVSQTVAGLCHSHGMPLVLVHMSCVPACPVHAELRVPCICSSTGVTTGMLDAGRRSRKGVCIGRTAEAASARPARLRNSQPCMSAQVLATPSTATVWQRSRCPAQGGHTQPPVGVCHAQILGAMACAAVLGLADHAI